MDSVFFRGKELMCIPFCSVTHTPLSLQEVVILCPHLVETQNKDV